MKVLLALASVTLLLAAGCTTRSKARAEAESAFRAGQQRNFVEQMEARRINIRVLGPVRHPEIIWSDGLTLARVIAAAGYYDVRDPRVILIIRQREQLSIPARDLLAGYDWPLEPGDTIELRP